MRSVVRAEIAEHSGNAEEVARTFMFRLSVSEKLQLRVSDYPRRGDDLAYWPARNDAERRVTTRIREKLANPQGIEQEPESHYPLDHDLWMSAPGQRIKRRGMAQGLSQAELSRRTGPIAPRFRTLRAGS